MAFSITFVAQPNPVYTAARWEMRSLKYVNILFRLLLLLFFVMVLFSHSFNTQQNKVEKKLFRFYSNLCVNAKLSLLTFYFTGK